MLFDVKVIDGRVSLFHPTHGSKGRRQLHLSIEDDSLFAVYGVTPQQLTTDSNHQRPTPTLFPQTYEVDLRMMRDRWNKFYSQTCGITPGC